MFKNIFTNEQGAIDLASIMVGVIVIGLIGGVVAASVFTVIPWAQDNAAKQQLDSIVSAQSAYKGLSSGVPPATPPNHTANSYADSSKLESAGLLSSDIASYCTTPTEDKQGYQAYVRSSTGKYWTVSNADTKPRVINPEDVHFACGSVLEPYVDNAPLRTQITYLCDTTMTIGIPIRERQSGGVVTWSDGETYTAPSGSSLIKKELKGGVEYTLSFDGKYGLFSHSIHGGDANPCFRSLDHWGSETGVTNASNAFHNLTNLESVPATIPSSIRLTSYMFSRIPNFNDPNIQKWDMSQVTDISGMFNEATSFNQPLNDWDVSNVEQMRSTFYGARAFNHPLNNWNVSKVTNMKSMFGNNHTYKQDLSMWNTASLIDGTTFAPPSSFPAEYLPLNTSQ